MRRNSQRIELKATDYTALNGRYLAELFVDFQSPKWDPAVGLAIKDHLKDLSVSKRRQLGHIVEKYLGDVNHNIGDGDLARSHYDEALYLKPDYVDALFTYSWFNYSERPRSDVDKMEVLFRRMTAIDSYDYRGFHGLGYALYMKAIKEPDSDRRYQLLFEATQQSLRASYFEH